MIRKIELFMSRIQKRGPDECWPWTGTIHNQNGYGIYRERECEHGKIRCFTASRVVAWLTYGPLRPEQLACHHCDNRICCNPKHLFVGSHYDNNMDAVAKKRYPNTRLTHCKHGHEFTPENIRSYSKATVRQCRQCGNNRARVYQAKRRAALRQAT